MAGTGTWTFEQVASRSANDAIPGMLFYLLTVTAVTVSDYMSQGSGPFGFCDVNFAYSHAGRDDTVSWFPSSENFQNHHVLTGGDGWDIATQNSSLPRGLEYGAVSGTTDGGFGGFSQVHTAFGYQAMVRLTGK
jgi:tannase